MSGVTPTVGGPTGDRGKVTKASQVAKAIVAFIAPAVVVIIGSVLDGSDGGSRITQAEWVTALGSAILTSAGVFKTRNAPLTPGGRNHNLRA